MLPKQKKRPDRQTSTRFMLQHIEVGPDNSQVCRVCLAMGVRMYHMAERGLSTVYAQVTGVVINSEDKLPQHLCWECVARLSSANDFIVKTSKTHWMLTDIVTTKGILTIDDIILIDRTVHQLESRLSKNIITYCLSTNTTNTNECSEEVNMTNEEDFIDLDSNICNIDTDILNLENGMDFDFSEPLISILDNDVLKEIHLDKELVEGDDEQAAADAVTFIETKTDEQWASVVEEENKKNLSYEEECVVNKQPDVLYDLLGSEEVVLVVEDINLDQSNTNGPYTVNGAQYPIAAAINCHSSMDNVTLGDNNNTEEAPSCTDASEPTGVKIIKAKSVSEFDNASHSVRFGSCNAASDTGVMHSHSTEDASICDKPFHCKSKLTKRIRKQLTKHPGFYNCTYCSYKTHLKNRLSRHMNSQHTKRTAYNCPECSFVTYDRSSLARHSNSLHMKTTAYNCSNCTFKTYIKSNLTKHIQSQHVKNILYSCSYCNHKTFIKGNLAKHMNKKHMERN